MSLCPPVQRPGQSTGHGWLALLEFQSISPFNQGILFLGCAAAREAVAEDSERLTARDYLPCGDDCAGETWEVGEVSRVRGGGAAGGGQWLSRRPSFGCRIFGAPIATGSRGGGRR